MKSVKTQPILWVILELGWSCRVVSSWGKADGILHLCFDLSLDEGGSREEDLTLGSAALFSWGQVPERGSADSSQLPTLLAAGKLGKWVLQSRRWVFGQHTMASTTSVLPEAKFFLFYCSAFCTYGFYLKVQDGFWREWRQFFNAGRREGGEADRAIGEVTIWW